jgi:superfamily I DNA and/or RNA helicase
VENLFAEVLEAHVLSSISSKTQQLILIGDHQQLRPKTQVYDLSVDSGKGYNLDISLFERLIEQKHPFDTLATQRRMRPSISR